MALGSCSPAQQHPMSLDYKTAFLTTLRSAAPKPSIQRQSLEDMLSTLEMLSRATRGPVPRIGPGNQSHMLGFGASLGQPSWSPQTRLAAWPHLRSRSHRPAPAPPPWTVWATAQGVGRTARTPPHTHFPKTCEPKEHVNRPLEKTTVAAQEYILGTLSLQGGP